MHSMHLLYLLNRIFSSTNDAEEGYHHRFLLLVQYHVQILISFFRFRVAQEYHRGLRFLRMETSQVFGWSGSCPFQKVC